LSILIPTPGAARSDPLAWACYASDGRFRRARHLEYISDRILDMESGKGPPRLVVSCPPRHGKSWFISRYFPGWYLGRHPSHAVALVTFQEGFSRKWGRLARDSFYEKAEALWGVTALPRASTACWEVYRGHERTEGMMQSIGAGGAITGKGANLLIIDDLIRDLAEAQNSTLRERQFEWYQSAIETRLEPPGFQVILSTRWHHDDLIGRLKKLQKAGELGDEYLFINLPAIAEDGETDPLGRKPGEALWPERFPAGWLRNKQKNVGPYVWGSLYQGKPRPNKGAVFNKDWFLKYEPGERLIKVPKHGSLDLNNSVRYGTVDLAASKKKKADYTAMGAWGYFPKQHALTLNDVVRDRMTPNEIIPRMKIFQRDNKLPVIYVERVSGWLLEKLGDIIKDMQRAGLPVVEVPVVMDKLGRAISASGPLSAGQVFLKDRAPWLNDLEEELITFTGQDDTHDDQVDMVTIGVAVFQECEAAGAPPEQKPNMGPQEEPEWDLGFQGEW
jgi:predicted phage terminase large subunit-like protein